MKRLSWDEYFIKLAYVVRERSNCLRLSVGAVIVKNKQIIATGYNGTPVGTINCIEGGCKRCLDRQQEKLALNERKDLCVCVHAEQNAILQSALHGISTNGTTMYETTAPCLQCAKMIINAGIVKVIFDSQFQDDLGVELLKKAGVSVLCVK